MNEPFLAISGKANQRPSLAVPGRLIPRREARIRARGPARGPASTSAIRSIGRNDS